MRSKTQLFLLTGILLALLLAFGSIGCLQSAFGLAVRSPASLWCTVTGITVLYALALQWKYGDLTFACLLALSGGYLCREGTAARQLWQLVYRLTTVYDRAYHWGVFRLVDTPWDAGFADLPLGIWAALICLTTVWAFLQQKKVWLPVLAALIPLAACAVVTDTVPTEGYLLALLTGLMLLILPDAVRRENPWQGTRLTLAAALPVTAAVIGLFLAVPRSTYLNRSAVLRENVLTALEHLPQLMEEGLAEAAADIQGKPARQVDLTRLGARIPFTYPVMEVTSEAGGVLYLRGQDFDAYDGLGWTATENRREAFFSTAGTANTVTIHTRRTLEQQFLPYYPATETVLVNGIAANSKNSDTYTILCRMLPRMPTEAPPQAAEDLSAYLALPEAARQKASARMEEYLPADAGNGEKASRIASLVRQSAVYDLNPEKMPAGEEDFALWFLEEADRGYCIHFATTAAVLLRSAGVPARYVTGYMLEALPGQTVTVTEENAHAWAEYFDPSLGCWIPLEATPASQEEPAAMPTETEATPASPEESSAATVPLPTENHPELPPQPETDEKNWYLLLLIPVFALVMAAQRSIRMELRRKRQRQGPPNQQALQRFREAERLARLLKETPAEELIELAQKAKYSPYQLTPEELQHFDSYCRSCHRRLKEKPWYFRLAYCYVYAVY